jgi:hypothetical protein
VTHPNDSERVIANKAMDAAYGEIAEAFAVALPATRHALRTLWSYRSVITHWARVEYRARRRRLTAERRRWRDRPAQLARRIATVALFVTAWTSAAELGERWGGAFTVGAVLAATAYLRVAGRQIPREHPTLPGAALLRATLGRAWVCYLITTVALQAALWPHDALGRLLG